MFFRKIPLLAAVLSAGLVAGSAQAEEQLLIGSTSTSSSQYGYFVSVGQIINQHVDGVRSSVVETGATVDNLRRIEIGRASCREGEKIADEEQKVDMKNKTPRQDRAEQACGRAQKGQT